MRRVAVLLMLVGGWACGGEERERPGSDCRCEGAVPGGTLRVACGEMQCVDGVTGYLCTGPNMAVATADACLAGDSGMPLTTGEDGGPPPMRDGGVVRRDAGPLPDGGCVTATYYRDADGDGYGDASDVMDACAPPFGYVDNDDDCLDSDASARPGGTEVCDAIDNDCDGTVASCGSFAGTYAGTYQIYTAERLGSTVINEMRCTGTSSITVSPSMNGTVTCNYGGSLGGFDSTQNGTVTGTLRPDGTFSGSVTHQFDSFDSGSRRTFAITGTIAGSRLDVVSTGSWRPHPMSAVPWDVEITIAGTR